VTSPPPDGARSKSIAGPAGTPRQQDPVRRPGPPQARPGEHRPPRGRSRSSEPHPRPDHPL